MLKKAIYQLEKRQHGLEHDLESNERVSLLEDSDRSDTDAIFIPLLDKELNKIIVFYDAQEKELLNDVAQLEEEVRQTEEAGLSGRGQYFDEDEDDEEEFLDDDDDDDDEETNGATSREPTRSPRRKRRKSSVGLSRQRSTGPFHSSYSPSDVCLTPCRRKLGRRRAIPLSQSLQRLLERRPRCQHHLSPCAKISQGNDGTRKTVRQQVEERQGRFPIFILTSAVHLDGQNQLCMGHAPAVQAQDHQPLRYAFGSQILRRHQLFRLSQDPEKVRSHNTSRPFVFLIIISGTTRSRTVKSVRALVVH